VKIYERHIKIKFSSSSVKLCYWNLSLFNEFSLVMNLAMYLTRLASLLLLLFYSDLIIHSF
jgi:hypothetical protein